MVIDILFYRKRIKETILQVFTLLEKASESGPSFSSHYFKKDNRYFLVFLMV